MDFSKMTNDQKLNTIANRILEASAERASAEANASALESKAREERIRAFELRKEIAELSGVLKHTQVQKNMEVNEAESVRLRQEAERILENIKQREAELQEKLTQQMKAESHPVTS